MVFQRSIYTFRGYQRVCFFGGIVYFPPFLRSDLLRKLGPLVKVMCSFHLETSHEPNERPLKRGLGFPQKHLYFQTIKFNKPIKPKNTPTKPIKVYICLYLLDHQQCFPFLKTFHLHRRGALRRRTTFAVGARLVAPRRWRFG